MFFFVLKILWSHSFSLSVHLCVCVYFFIHRIFLSRCMYVRHKTWKLLHNGALHEKFNMYNVGFSPILAGLLGCWALVRLFIWVGVLQLTCFPLFCKGEFLSKRDGPIFIHIQKYRKKVNVYIVSLVWCIAVSVLVGGVIR